MKVWSHELCTASWTKMSFSESSSRSFDAIFLRGTSIFLKKALFFFKSKNTEYSVQQKREARGRRVPGVASRGAARRAPRSSRARARSAEAAKRGRGRNGAVFCWKLRHNWKVPRDAMLNGDRAGAQVQCKKLHACGARRVWSYVGRCSPSRPARALCSLTRTLGSSLRAHAPTSHTRACHS